MRSVGGGRAHSGLITASHDGHSANTADSPSARSYSMSVHPTGTDRPHSGQRPSEVVFVFMISP